MISAPTENDKHIPTVIYGNNSRLCKIRLLNKEGNLHIFISWQEHLYHEISVFTKAMHLLIMDLTRGFIEKQNGSERWNKLTYLYIKTLFVCIVPRNVTLIFS